MLSALGATEQQARGAVIKALHADRWNAHQLLFKHRHTEESADAHREIISLIYGPQPRLVLMGFRGIGKSTLTEEAAVIEALYREFRNMVIIGSSYDRACERLAAVARELVYNERIEQIYGPQKGKPWTENKIVLSNGACVQALGQGQDMRGLKHLDFRPDCALVDDVEGRDDVRTEEARRKTRDWFRLEFLPGLADPVRTPVRLLATPMDRESLPLWLERQGWPTRRFPIYHEGESGTREATWPGKFPIPKVAEIERDYAGDVQAFGQEYLCIAARESDRVFRPEMFHVKHLERSWHAVYAMIDPARTTNRTSATTGWAVWSWIGRRLHVWAAGAGLYKPDEIIDLVFTINDEFSPVAIGVEEDGLNEFILQPLRHEQTRRGQVVPFRALRAPRGKLDFIRALQPFFQAGEITFDAELGDLQAQLMSFPTGRIDAPNALAYALTLRPGLPVYEVSPADLIDEVEPDPHRILYVCAHAHASVVAAALVQVDGEELRILADWVVEGQAADVVPGLNAEATMAVDAVWRPEKRTHKDWTEELKITVPRMTLQREAPRWVVPPVHADRLFNVGLEQALRRLPAKVMRGSEPEYGRQELRDKLKAGNVRVSERAGWTLRALAGGYAMGIRKGGAIGSEPEPGPYRVLMEGLESFAGMMGAMAVDEDGDDGQPIAYNRAGQAYRSALPQRR